MCFQTLSISNDILCSINHFLGTHPINSYPRRNQLMIMQFDQKSKSGFCYSTKRVSKSSTGLVKGGALVGVRCEVAQNDGFYIRRCVELARTAIGSTSPNPMVGCVIVKDGKIVGEGYHPKAGQPHAEVFALRDAGNLAEGGTAYVTLEPCNHFGRTPPCTDALIKARVKKVVVGMVDPNPIVASKGVHKLRDAGIEVTVGVEEELCKKLNEAYIHQMLTGKPFVTLRYSMSVNGHIINQLGDTGLDFGGYYSKLLQEYDAVVISASLLSDNLSFPTSKEPGANQPVRIILTKSLDSPIHITAFNSETASKVIIFTVKEASLPQELTEKGVENVVFERISLVSILEYCKRQGFCSVLLDLRGNFADFDEILREGSELDLFQKYVVEILPVWGWSKESSFKNFPENFKVKSLTSRVLGETILLEGYFK